jgi:tetraacyldisaccharide-1-P 4'-kinase
MFYSKVINYRGKNLIFIILQIMLYILSGIYYIILYIKRANGYKNKIKINIPVISVGNITWGGVGKTPVVIYLAHQIIQRGKNVAIVHHGKRFKDEVELLGRKLPQVEILHSGSKKELILGLESRKDVQIAIIDDGFQNWNIHRDLDILVMDYNAPLGNGYLIPRGNLREEPKSIGRADIVIINKVISCDNLNKLESMITSFNFKGDIVCSCYEVEKIRKINNGEEISPSSLRGKKVALVAGIGRPEYFEHLIQGTIQKFFYPDHYGYDRQDVQIIIEKLDKEVEYILTTEKDEAKLMDLMVETENRFFLSLYVVGVGLRFIKNEQAIHRRLDILLDSFRL